MKNPKIRRRFLIVFVVLLVFLCWGEIATPSHYCYPHSVADAVRVELLHNQNTDAFASDDSKFVLLKTLEGAEMIDFLNEARIIETSYCVTPPPRGYGEYVARVTYSNGDVEYYGSNHLEFVENGTERTGVGAYYFAGDAMERLILGYCGIGTDNK